MAEDPFTVVPAAVIEMNELFNTLVAGGFTEGQALSLLAKLILEHKQQEETKGGDN